MECYAFLFVWLHLSSNLNPNFRLNFPVMQVDTKTTITTNSYKMQFDADIDCSKQSFTLIRACTHWIKIYYTFPSWPSLFHKVWHFKCAYIRNRQICWVHKIQMVWKIHDFIFEYFKQNWPWHYLLQNAILVILKHRLFDQTKKYTLNRLQLLVRAECVRCPWMLA